MWNIVDRLYKFSDNTEKLKKKKSHYEACFSKIRLTFKHYFPKSKYRYLLLCKLKPNQFPLVWSQNIADNQIKPTFTDLDSKTGYWDFWENGPLARWALLGSTYLSKKDLVYLQRLKLITPWSVVSLYVAILVNFLWDDKVENIDIKVPTYPIELYLCFHNSREIWHLFSRAPIRNSLWCHYR